MNKNYDKWIADKDEKWTKMTRALSQDVGLIFKKDILGQIFPKKIITDKKTGKEIDIGKINCGWLYDIIIFFKVEEKHYNKILEFLALSYSYGFNINNIPQFKSYILVHVVPTFSKKINELSQIAKLGFMDTLEKPNKIDKLKEGDDIQW